MVIVIHQMKMNNKFINKQNLSNNKITFLKNINFHFYFKFDRTILFHIFCQNYKMLQYYF